MQFDFVINKATSFRRTLPRLASFFDFEHLSVQGDLIGVYVLSVDFVSGNAERAGQGISDEVCFMQRELRIRHER